jgi:hypothetical protein
MGRTLVERYRRTLLVVALAAVAGLVVLALMAADGGFATTAGARTIHKAKHHAKHHAKRHANRHARHPAIFHSVATTKGDGDNVQSGDQSSPDTPGESSGESSGESGSEAPNGDGPGGHADEPGDPNADHQCPPSCGRGEQG